MVLWMPKVFDADFLLEFDVTIEREDQASLQGLSLQAVTSEGHQTSETLHHG